jgi:hypothetical protein
MEQLRQDFLVLTYTLPILLFFGVGLLLHKLSSMKPRSRTWIRTRRRYG